MARSIRGSKGPGYEYWGARPGSTGAIGKVAKKIIHKIERQQSKEITRQELKFID